MDDQSKEFFQQIKQDFDENRDKVEARQVNLTQAQVQKFESIADNIGFSFADTMMVLAELVRLDIIAKEQEYIKRN